MMNSKFEGPEKKLEIILSSACPDIRDNADDRWGKVVRASRAKILSEVGSPQMDAYLLSESSLFVWADRLLMITCGRTTLVDAVPQILRVIPEEQVAFVFYEQKNFYFPREQPSTFKADATRLTRVFPGKYYTLGPMNYDHLNIFYSSHSPKPPEGDATLQLLMHAPEPEALAPFCAGTRGDPERVMVETGIAGLYDGEVLTDGYLFSPSGFSMNGLRLDRYFTIHVTPQNSGSYVSFETNVFEDDFTGTIRRVIGIFKPRRFSLVLTTSMDERCRTAHRSVVDCAPGYRIADKTLYEMDCGYSVTFMNYLANK